MNILTIWIGCAIFNIFLTGYVVSITEKPMSETDKDLFVTVFWLSIIFAPLLTPLFLGALVGDLFKKKHE